MNPQHYKSFTSFKLKGEYFLSLEKDGCVHIYDQDMGFFGAWESTMSFKSNYQKGMAKVLVRNGEAVK